MRGQGGFGPAAAALLLVLAGAARGEAAIAFREIGVGITYAPLHVESEDVTGTVTGHAFDVDLARVSVHLVPAPKGARAPVDRLAAPYPARLAVNASFFDGDGRTIGEAIAHGEHVGGAPNRRWGALVLDHGMARIVAGESVPASGDLVVQGIPRLVVEGRVPRLKPQVAERTAVCATGPVLTIVVATEAVEASAFARFLARSRREGGLGCADALNLDGGSSTQLSVRLPGLAVDAAGAWGVPNAIVVVPGASS